MCLILMRRLRNSIDEMMRSIQAKAPSTLDVAGAHCVLAAFSIPKPSVHNEPICMPYIPTIAMFSL